MVDCRSWHAYILRCRDGSYYTGITNNLERRLEEHNGGTKGARYTRSRRPVELVYHEPCNDKSAALKREFEIRKLSRREKEQLVGLCDH